MCGRYSNTITGPEFDLRMGNLLRLSRPDGGQGFERFNIAPTDEVLAAVEDEEGRRMELLRWGLVRGWSRDAESRFQMINARCETVLERAAYRDLVSSSRHRCLIVADGWYEWQRAEDPRQRPKPVHFSLHGRRPFCFAGLWANSSCTILTSEANDIARPIHDRMPVVLDQPAEWDAWLDPALAGSDFAEVLVPLPSERLEVKPANPLVNSVRNDGPGCLEPELTLL